MAHLDPNKKSGVAVLRLTWCIEQGDALWDHLLNSGLAVAHVAIAVLEDADNFTSSVLNGRKIMIEGDAKSPFSLDWGKLHHALNDLERDRGGVRWLRSGDRCLSSATQRPSMISADEVQALVQAHLIGDPETREKLTAAYEDALRSSDLDRVAQAFKIAETSKDLAGSLVASDQAWDRAQNRGPA